MCILGMGTPACQRAWGFRSGAQEGHPVFKLALPSPPSPEQGTPRFREGTIPSEPWTREDSIRDLRQISVGKMSCPSLPLKHDTSRARHLGCEGQGPAISSLWPWQLSRALYVSLGRAVGFILEFGVIGELFRGVRGLFGFSGSYRSRP